MFRRSLACFTAIQLGVIAADTSPEICPQGPKHMRIGIRHIEGKGIGYNQGYTTLETFLASDPSKHTLIPFLDLRGHVFDNGKCAANAGLGLRYVINKRLLGINSYYDYRNTSHQHYNQASIGLESLGHIWDFRINGYLPIGWKNSPFFHTHFSKFKNNYMYLTQTRNFAMKGANAEIGIHVDHYKNMPLYFAAGPYYLTGTGKTTWGGQLRISLDLCDRYIRLEGNTSYDHFFKWIGQGQVSVNIPFGRNVKLHSKKLSCSQEKTVYTRAVQPIYRNEIIPIGKEHIQSLGTNPTTNQPYYFVFVDNTSSSLGTYESPVPTLAEAQNLSTSGQIIYVFPGNGLAYDTAPSGTSGMSLQEGQMLLGASSSHTLNTTVGNITIPPQTSNLPIILNSLSHGSVITLNNNNTVSGFYIENNYQGLAGTNINNLTATQNTIMNVSGQTDVIAGISLHNVTGTIAIYDSSFPNIGYGNGIYLVTDNSSTLDQFTVTNSSFYDMNNTGTNNQFGNGIFANLQDGVITDFLVSKSTFTSMSNPTGKDGGNGIFAYIHGGTLNEININASAFSDMNQTGSGIYLASNQTIDRASVSYCDFTDINAANGLVVSVSTSASLSSLDVTHCTFNQLDGGTGVAIGMYNSSGFSTLAIRSNLFTKITNSFSIEASTKETIVFDVANNSFKGDASNGDGWATYLHPVEGNTCLQFVNNQAYPNQSTFPYAFYGTGATFNRTAGSDTSTNIGQFLLVGVSDAGSCTQ